MYVLPGLEGFDHGLVTGQKCHYPQLDTGEIDLYELLACRCLEKLSYGDAFFSALGHLLSIGLSGTQASCLGLELEIFGMNAAVHRMRTIRIFEANGSRPLVSISRPQINFALIS